VVWLSLHRFGYRGAFLLFGVPYTNLLFIAVTQAVLLFIARQAADLCERAGYHVAGPVPAAVEPPVGPTDEGAVALRTRTLAPVATRPWAPFWVAVGIPTVGLYAGMVVNSFVLKALNPF
jgi:hypothetical protein